MLDIAGTSPWADAPLFEDAIEPLRSSRDHDLDAASTTTDSEMLSNEALTGSDLGFSVLEFCQRLQVGEHAGFFDSAATIVRKHTPSVWREARWQVSWFAESLAPARARQH
jgi:hypothetical protein